MSETVKLLFGVHAHQPAGNFPEVIRDARERCYGPFLEVVERHPEFPFAIHISGWLLEYLAREFAQDVRRLRAMVDRGQAEIFGGGDTEPVLAALPEADRRGQLRAMSDRVERRFGVRPRGAWLTERVWEATVVPALIEGGIEYVAVDDYHFLCTGQPQERLDGYFSTEEGNRRLDLFPISEALRYAFPFASAGEAVAQIERMLPGGAAIYFDDIEKFGVWPGTHDWVYRRRWLEDFIEAVVRSPKIEPMRYADHHGAHATHGTVYLPTVSYVELGAWALPPRNATRFARLIERAKHEGTFDQDKPYLRGGHWRNFFSRYPESNWMHKRMLSASNRYHALPSGARTNAMRADLHLAQANDAYWHGLFGGIYLPHLRRHVYSAIARLERALDARQRRKAVERVDLDMDGRAEALLANDRMLAIVKPHEGASVRELTHYRLEHNFCDTLARREEQYYDKVRAGPVAAPAGAPASIHDRTAFRTHITPEDLAVDAHPRALFVDFLRLDGAEPTFVSYEETASRGSVLAFAGRCGEVELQKRIKIDRRGVAVSYALASQVRVSGTLIVECNVSMPSCDGPGGAYVVQADALGGFGESLMLDDLSRIDLIDSELLGSLALVYGPPARVETRPLFTVSQSEAGFEKIMQAATIRALWPVDLGDGRTRSIDVRMDIRSSSR